MDNSLVTILKRIVKILPSDWNKMVFSVFARECVVNGKKSYSKEFKCLCLTDSYELPIDLVKVYDDDYDTTDLFFDLLNYLYKNHLDDKEVSNFIVFKLFNDGNYELNKIHLDDSTSNGDILDLTTHFLNKNE